MTVATPMDMDAPVVKQQGTEDEVELSLLLRSYYSHVFPHRWYFQWLNYGPVPGPNFSHREFSFTLPGDIYIRYQSFKDADSLKADLVRLVPIKIDIGAIYTARPREKKALRPEAFQPVEKELVFDIDMTDYDEIRTCCSGGNICPKCWKFMAIAVKVLDAALREDFGFQQLLWVYSGRRGVHCWVADARARRLGNDARKAVVGWLEVIRGGATQGRKVNLPSKLSPSLQRAYGILKGYFHDLILEEQAILDNEPAWRRMIQALPDDELKKLMGRKWASAPEADAATRWKFLQETCNVMCNAIGKTSRYFQLKNAHRDVIFQYCYPRLDDKVTIQINHLLKSPFCVHPKTGRVCVPIDPARIDEFDPFTVPTIGEIVEEAAVAMKARAEAPAEEGARKQHIVMSTRLAPYITLFRTFVRSLSPGSASGMASTQDDPMDF